jgi:hypothetical protein
MVETIAILFVYSLYVYTALGVAFALAFVTVGVSRADSQAAGSSIAFRLLVLPGSVALWPLLLRRWISGKREPPEGRNPHT